MKIVNFENKTEFGISVRGNNMHAMGKSFILLLPMDRY